MVQSFNCHFYLSLPHTAPSLSHTLTALSLPLKWEWEGSVGKGCGRVGVIVLAVFGREKNKNNNNNKYNMKDNFYLLGCLTRSFDKDHEKQDLVHLIGSFFYTNSFDINKLKL